MESNFEIANGSILFWQVLWAGMKDGFNPGSGLVMAIFVTLLLLIILLGKRFAVWGWVFVCVYIGVIFCVHFIGVDSLFTLVPGLREILVVSRYSMAMLSGVLALTIMRDWYMFKRYGSDEKNIFKASCLRWSLNQGRLTWLLFFPIGLCVLLVAVLCGLLQGTWPIDSNMAFILIKAFSGKFTGLPYVLGVYALSLGLPLVGIVLGMKSLCIVESKDLFMKRYSKVLVVLAGFYLSITILYSCIF